MNIYTYEIKIWSINSTVSNPHRQRAVLWAPLFSGGDTQSLLPNSFHAVHTLEDENHYMANVL